jgi:hypothetical protein|tara:strand:+ start:8010 stop:8234 length:225 start_codon:yes stop_codon:yes gene_type:complete
MATRFWVRTNEASNASLNRKQHVKEHGGEFIRDPQGWKWVAPVNTPVVKPVNIPVEKPVNTPVEKPKKRRLFKK